MSRSYRKTPIIGNCADSDKKDKREYNKSLRELTKIAFRKGQLDNIPLYKLDGNHNDIWDWAKDGKHYFNPKKHPELMRK